LDLRTLTENQWIMLGFIAFASTLLLLVILAFMFSRVFRKSFMSFDENFVPMTRHQVAENFFPEFFALWVGRIFAIAYRPAGRENIPLGRDHCLSVLAWVFLLTGIAGYFSGIYVRAFWEAFIGLVILVTFMYAWVKAVTIRPETADKEEKYEEPAWDNDPAR
jgi:uncharacterized membrane protein